MDWNGLEMTGHAVRSSCVPDGTWEIQSVSTGLGGVPLRPSRRLSRLKSAAAAAPRAAKPIHFFGVLIEGVLPLCPPTILEI